MHEKSLYKVEYPDGTTEQLASNIIAENMMSQVDSVGHNYQVLTEVTYNKNYDSAIDKVNGFYQVNQWEPTQEEDNQWTETLSGMEVRLS